MEALPNLGPQYARDFHDVFPELARKNGITLLPFLLDGVAGRADLNQADGVHPNYRGERIVADQLWRSLERELSAASSQRPARAP
jgi:acyl-CoA thioesterase-1